MHRGWHVRPLMVTIHVEVHCCCASGRGDFSASDINVSNIVVARSAHMLKWSATDVSRRTIRQFRPVTLFLSSLPMLLCRFILFAESSPPFSVNPVWIIGLSISFIIIISVIVILYIFSLTSTKPRALNIVLNRVWLQLRLIGVRSVKEGKSIALLKQIGGFSGFASD